MKKRKMPFLKNALGIGLGATTAFGFITWTTEETEKIKSKRDEDGFIVIDNDNVGGVVKKNERDAHNRWKRHARGGRGNLWRIK